MLYAVPGQIEAVSDSLSFDCIWWQVQGYRDLNRIKSLFFFQVEFM